MTAPHVHRFNEGDFTYWVDRVGRWFDVSGPAGNHLLDGRDLPLTMLNGIYVGVASDETALYAGKVKRSDRGVADRFRGHGQPIESWASVWLLPLELSCSPALVRCFEAALIRRHRPLHNSQHNRSPRRLP